MTMYRCTDGLGPEMDIEAETREEAARIWVGPTALWRQNNVTYDVVDVLVRELGPDGQLVENNVIADSDYIEIDLRTIEATNPTPDDVYLVGDQYSGQEWIRADSPDDAIDEYLDGGDWTPDEGGTVWYTITAVDRDGERSERKVSFDPPEPQCTDGHSHDWASPIVHGHGGGVIIHEVCAHCGLHKYTDTWATDPTDGEQGLTSVEYRREGIGG